MLVILKIFQSCDFVSVASLYEGGGASCRVESGRGLSCCWEGGGFLAWEDVEEVLAG